MRSEYEEIVKLFQLPKSERLDRLQEIFDLTVAFFERYRDLKREGSDEEKAKLYEQMQHLHALVEQASKESAEASGLTMEELSDLSEDPSRLSEEEQQFIRQAQEKLKPFSHKEKTLKKGRKKGRQNWTKM